MLRKLSVTKTNCTMLYLKKELKSDSFLSFSVWMQKISWAKSLCKLFCMIIWVLDMYHGIV